MSEFLQRLKNAVISHGLFVSRQRILVAASGGVDSMVLLHALHSLAKDYDWQLHVAHFNHQLRGRASDADEKLVRQTADALKLSLTVGQGNVKAFAQKNKVSIEMAARQLRHSFLANVAKRKKVTVVALAHHADDQVELFFLRLLRGTGGEGLAGMKWRSRSFVDKKILLVRPLLDCTKADLLVFAQTRKIPFRQDATNAANDFLRNRIRNELLPLLRDKYQPAIAKTVLRLMDIAGAESEYVTEAARQSLRQKFSKRGGFAKLPVAVQRKMLQSQLAAHGADFDLVEQLRAMPDKFVSLSAEITVARDAHGHVKFKRINLREFNLGKLSVKLHGRAGQVDFANQTFRWQIKHQSGSLPPTRSPRQEFFDADAIGPKIILRHWRAGDRFQPIGLNQSAKLQDLFVNAKIPAARRRHLVFAATRTGTIFWVEGLRIGDGFKLTSQTRRQFIWQY